MNLNDLDELIPRYASNKAELDSYKKICEQENAQIKAIMKDFAVQRKEAGSYVATYSVSRRESFDEDKLLQIAHHYGIPEIVKTREYIDFDALEKAIYDGKISTDVLLEMDKAKEVKEVVTLKVTKKKEKKSNE